MINRRLTLLTLHVGAALAVAGCAVRKPAVVTAPAPMPSLAPPAPTPSDWRDLPLSPGSWHYATEAYGTAARFGATPDLVLACHQAARTITLARPGATGALTIRTSYSARALPALDGTATLAASDRFFDEIAFSRGRFTVESPGAALLVVPAWAEPARVIEDCRAPAAAG